MNSYGALDSLAEGVASRQPCHEAGSSNREDNNIQLGPLDGSSGFELAMRSGSHSRERYAFVCQPSCSMPSVPHQKNILYLKFS